MKTERRSWLRTCLKAIALCLFCSALIFGFIKVRARNADLDRQRTEDEFRRRSVETRGVIVSIVESSSIRTYDTGTLILEPGVRIDFSFNVAGREYSVSNFGFGHTIETTKIGSHPRVCYNPDDPEDAVVRDTSDKTPCGALPPPFNRT